MNPSSGKPFAPSCERNRDPILGILREAFADCRNVLEIGSGSGQHAVYFAAALPHLQWQASERSESVSGVQSWLDEAALANTPPAIVLDVGQEDWPSAAYDAVFTANTLHIMAWAEVQRLFARLPAIMDADCILVVYGPFKVAGEFTSASNAAFDAWLHEQAAHMGIRDLADVDALAAGAGLQRVALHSMPANNFCVVWKRGAA